MNHNSVPSPASGDQPGHITVGAAISITILTVGLLVMAGLMPRLAGNVRIPASPEAAGLHTNPELKVLDYPAASMTARDLRTNPELKVLTYAIVDKAAFQSLTGSPEGGQTFPEAMDNGQYASPELRYLRYAVPAATNTVDLHVNPELKLLLYTHRDKAAIQTVSGPEARTLQFPEALDSGLATNPELKYLHNSRP